MIAYRIILISHLFGLAFGLGGATTIDSIILVAARRRKVTRELVDVVHAAAGLIAGAMALLAVSGVAFFFVGVEPTPKFWAKMVIVGVACLNGLAAHRLVFPLLQATAASGNGQLRLRPWSARLAATSAAVSSISWSGALILGGWRGLSLGMAPILTVYVLILAGGVLVSVIFVAPRVFMYAPAQVGRRQSVSLREMPAAAAFSVALAIADLSLAIATRLRERNGGAETDGFEELKPAADTAWSDKVISTGTLEDHWVHKVQPDENYLGDDQYRRPAFDGWTTQGFDVESEAGTH